MNKSTFTQTYPYNLLAKVLGRAIAENELPDDIDKSLHYGFTLLSELHGECVLTLHYKDSLTRKEIADKMQCTTTRVNAIISTSMEELSLGNRHMLFTHGYTYCCENKIIGPWLISIGQEIKPEILYNLPVYDIGVDLRCKHNLNRGGIYTVGKLVKKTEDNLLRIRGMGTKSVEMIKGRLNEMKLSLAEDQD